MTTPPRLARAILRLALPEHQRDNVVGDLDAEYAHHVRPARTAIGARAGYWRQVLGSLGPAMAMRHRRRRLDALAPRTSRPDRARMVVDHVGQDLKAGRPLADTAPGIRRRRDCDRRPGHGRELRYLQHRRRRAPAPASVRRPLSAGARLVGQPARDRTQQRVSRRLRRSARSGGQPLGPRSAGRVHHGNASTLSGIGDAQRLASSTVSPELFDLLGVRAASGRTLVAADASGDAVVVVSDRLWRTVLSASPAAVGTSLTVDGVPAVIVGVLPPSFGFPSRDVDLWIPLRNDELARSRSAHYLDVVGRLAPGVSMAAGRDVLQTVAARLAIQYPETNRGWGVTVVSLQDSVVGDVRTPLLVLVAAVGCVLLIACANVAALLLARGTGRARELAVRIALGATRGRIVRQQLTESITVAVAGGAAGLLIAYWLLDVLPAAAGFDLPRSSGSASTLACWQSRRSRP